MADETPQEREAEAKLDEVTREVGEQELDRVEPRTFGVLAPLMQWMPWPRRRRQGLRDVLHGDAPKE